MTRKLYSVLIVVAPTHQQCYRTAVAFGITPGLPEGLRCVTKAASLRGWSRGTPFIAQDRDSWAGTPAGELLGDVLDLYVRQGRLRIANETDLAGVGAHLFDDPAVGGMAASLSPRPHFATRSRAHV